MTAGQSVEAEPTTVGVETTLRTDSLKEFVAECIRAPMLELRRVNAAAGSYDSEILEVRTADCRARKLFLKNFGVARNQKSVSGARAAREIRMYTDILAGGELGTATFLGASRDSSLLLLEYVEGPTLSDADSGFFADAAAWLAHLQAYAASLESNLLAFLPRHDTRFFNRKAARALRALSAVAPELATRLKQTLVSYAGVVQQMIDHPTIVHGSFRPSDIIVLQGGRSLRVCPIDWERAALGSPLYDLAYLSAGFADEFAFRLLERYVREAEELGLSFPSSDLYRSFQYLRVHRQLTSLRQSALRRESEAHLLEGIENVHRWLISSGT